MSVEASIILQFGQGVDESTQVVVEFDDKHSANLDWGGKLMSSFPPDVNPVILIDHPSTVRIVSVLSTDGTVNKLADNSLSASALQRSRNLECLFTNKDSEIAVSYFDVHSLSVEWRGRSASTPLLSVNDSGSNIIVPSADMADKVPYVCDATLYANFIEQWQLVPPSMNLADDETYVIYVVIYVEKAL